MLELLGDRDDLLVDELPYRGDDFGLELGQPERLGEFWSCAQPFRTRRPGPARRRCTWSPARSGLRGGSARAPAWPASARRWRRPDGRARCPSRARSCARRSAAVNFHSRITASACAANASLSSIRSISLSVSPALAERDLGRGHRPDAHDVRRHACRPPRDQPHQRRQPEFGGLLRCGDDAHRRGVVLAAGVARRDGGVRIIACPERVSAWPATRPRCRRGGARRCRSTSSPFRVRTVTGMISSARMPSFCAATAR